MDGEAHRVAKEGPRHGLARDERGLEPPVAQVQLDEHRADARVPLLVWNKHERDDLQRTTLCETKVS